MCFGGRYAPYLLHAVSTDVWTVPAGGAFREPGAKLVLAVKSESPTLVGSFQLTDGRRAALVQNQALQSAEFNVTFANGTSSVRRIDPASGAEVAVVSRIELTAGCAELYVSAS